MWALEKMGPEELGDYAHYLDEKMIAEMTESYIREERDDDLSDFYMYMNKDTKQALVKYYLDHQMNDELMELLSFMK